MNPTEIPVYGQQETSAYYGYFESTGYHPPLLFNRERDCLASKLRSGKVRSADDREVRHPHASRQQPGEGYREIAGKILVDNSLIDNSLT